MTEYLHAKSYTYARLNVAVHFPFHFSFDQSFSSTLLTTCYSLSWIDAILIVLDYMDVHIEICGYTQLEIIVNGDIKLIVMFILYSILDIDFINLIIFQKLIY